MESAIRQSTIANRQSTIPDAWLPLDQAAELLGHPLRTMQYRCTAQWVKSGLAELRRPAIGKGKPIWWVHRSCHPGLSSCPDRRTRNERLRDSLLASHPQHHVERAYRKAHWVNEWRKMVQGHKAGRLEGWKVQGSKVQGSKVQPSTFNAQPSTFNLQPSTFALQPSTSTAVAAARRIVATAKDIEGDDFKISVRSLQSWWRLSNTLGPDGHILGVRALVDGYSGPTVEFRSPEAVNYFYALFHTQSKHSARTCHEATVREARRQGWTWPGSYSAATRWLADHDDRAETCLRREGGQAYSHKFMPHIVRDYTTIEPGHLYIADHSQHDLWCVHNGEQLRPWMTSIIDARSRSVVGWHVGTSPNQDTIVAAMRMAFADWAIPQQFYIDQGKDFCSQLVTGVTKRERDGYRRALGPEWQQVLRHQQGVFWHGVLGELGITVIYADPYSPWAKALKERWYGRMHDEFDKQFATYCGNSAASRPECLNEIRRGYTDSQKRTLRATHGRDWKRMAVLKFVDQSDVPSLDEVRARAGDWIELYQRSPHRGLDGATPSSVWATAQRLRKAADRELLSLMQARGVYRVHANGVTFKVGASTLSYGAACPAIRRLAGRDVFITLDPADCSCCYAYTADPEKRTFIDRLTANQPIPVGTSVEQLREAIRNVKRRRKVAGQAAREAPKRTRNAAQEVTALRREQLTEARATGTDAVDATPIIAPVRTGFEGLSIPDRVAFEPSDPGDIEDLFDDDFGCARTDPDPDADDELDCLFSDESGDDDDTADDALEAIL